MPGSGLRDAVVEVALGRLIGSPNVPAQISEAELFGMPPILLTKPQKADFLS